MLRKPCSSYWRRITGALLVSGLAACNGAAPDDIRTPLTSRSCPDIATSIGHFIHIPSGSFIKGSQPLYPDERPEMRLQVEGFWLQSHEVTTAQFAAFVTDTGYVTDAEQSVLDGRDDAGSALFVGPSSPSTGPGKWQLSRDANWRAPDGHKTMPDDRAAWPVVHVTKRDAEAYANWAGGRLPSEVEWEYAATLGLPNPNVPASGAYGPKGPRANTWQGIFPIADLGQDGHQGRAPIGCYEPDEMGLYDMIGNVWEWTDTPYGEVAHTLKGGSFLCADNFCRRYRPAARHPQESDFSASHIGFRIVRDAQP